MFRFKKNELILSAELIDIANTDSISDTKTPVAPIETSSENKEMDMSSDKVEMSLDNNKEYEIIISKEGCVPFSQKVNSSTQSHDD